MLLSPPPIRFHGVFADIFALNGEVAGKDLFQKQLHLLDKGVLQGSMVIDFLNKFMVVSVLPCCKV